MVKVRRRATFADSGDLASLGNENGLTLIKPIKKAAPTIKVVMFTTFGNVHYEGEAYRAGASGFLLKTDPLDHIVSLIRKASGGADSPDLFPNKSRYGGLRPHLSEDVIGDERKRLSLLSALRQFFRPQGSQTAD